MSWKAVALQQHVARPRGRVMTMLLKPAAIAIMAALGLGVLAIPPWIVVPASAAFATAGHFDQEAGGGAGEWAIIFVAICTLVTPVWSVGRIVSYLIGG